MLLLSKLPSLLNLFTPQYFLVEIFFITLITLKQLRFYAKILFHFNYLSPSQKMIQEKYMKGSLAKIRSRKLAKNEFKKVYKAEIKWAAK